MPNENEDLFWEGVEDVRKEHLEKMAKKTPLDWHGDHLQWFIHAPPEAKSDYVRDMLLQWCTRRKFATEHLQLKLNPANPKGAGYNLLVINKKVRCAYKFSGLNYATDRYRFSQFYPGKFDVGILFGIRPGFRNIWVVPQDILLAHTKSQVDETKARSLGVNPFDIPSWMEPYGGSVGDGLDYLDFLIE